MVAEFLLHPFRSEACVFEILRVYYIFLFLLTVTTLVHLIFLLEAPLLLDEVDVVVHDSLPGFLPCLVEELGPPFLISNGPFIFSLFKNVAALHG